jgi:hypothetical protein
MSTPQSIPTSTEVSNREVVTVTDLAREFGLSENAIRYHLRRLFPDNARKYFRIRGSDIERARKYLRQVTRKGGSDIFSKKLIAELTAIVGTYGISVRALQNDKAGRSRALLVTASKTNVPKIQIMTSQTEVLRAL